MINDFAQNFQDVMSRERAKKKLFELRMEKGELDKYMSQFQQLAKLAGYYEQMGMICHRYFQRLPQGLQESMIAFEPTRHYQKLDDWIEGASCQHSKYLMYQSYFGGQNVTFGLHLPCRYVGLHHFFFFLPYTEARCMIRSCGCHCTIRSCGHLCTI